MQNVPTEIQILMHLWAPELVTALAIAGRLDFNPLTDTLTNENGEQVKLDAPTGFELPPNGFAVEDARLPSTGCRWFCRRSNR